jgi:type IV secretion system protein VirB10
VIVQLDSPATDSLGRAGIAGTVDTKALQRFGPPLFFSVLTDLPQYLAQRGGGTGTTINAFSNTQSASQEALRSIIELYSRLSPTLTKDPAGVVTIIAARDLDFSGVYPPRKKKMSR